MMIPRHWVNCLAEGGGGGRRKRRRRRNEEEGGRRRKGEGSVSIRYIKDRYQSIFYFFSPL